MIETKDLKISFGELKVLKGITQTIKQGEKVVIIGPSGSGKSTFLRCLNLLETPDYGSILFDETPIAYNAKDTNIWYWDIWRLCRESLARTKAVLMLLCL